MPEIPETAIEEAARLTRHARAAVDDEEAAAYRERRDELLAEYELIPRVRDDPDGTVLVCYPDTWVDGSGVVLPEAIEDTDEAVEVRLSGRPEGGSFEEADAHNRDLVEAVREEHGEVHAANATAFADFMGNHHAARVETATAADIQEFQNEYYPRNVWPTPEQAAVVDQSLRYVFEVAGEPFPVD